MKTSTKIKILLSCMFLFVVIYSISLLNIDNNTITIGSKGFTEPKIVTYILKNEIEAQTDYKVKLFTGIGETSLLQGAMQKGDIDIYIDYTSTAYETVLGHTYSGQSNKEIYETVKKEYNNKYNEDWISLLGFENTNAVLCNDFCKENDITKLSQLKNYTDFSFAAQTDFFTRTDGLESLEKKYDFKISEKNKIKLDHSLIYTALENNEVDLALGYTTDGQLYNSDITILEDDLNAFAKYDAGIVVNNNTLKEYPDLKKVLKSFEESISEKQMQKMNYEVDIMGESPQKAAMNWEKTNE